MLHLTADSLEFRGYRLDLVSEELWFDRFPPETKEFSLFKSVQTGSGAR
jgi:hypothetical protein